MEIKGRVIQLQQLKDITQAGKAEKKLIMREGVKKKKKV